MINLVRVYLKNFAALYHSLGLTEIEINRYNSENKIVLIIGPNGSGKSSLLSEFTPLPLEHTNNRTKSRILPDKDGIKELEYVVDDEWVYKCFIEYTKKTNCYLYKKHISDSNFEDLNPTGNVTTYLELLEKELGFSKNYTKVGYLSSTITNFINMKPSERNEYISEWLPNISLFLQGYKTVQKRFNLKKKEIENLNKDLGKMLEIDYELKLEEIKNSLNFNKEKIEEINTKIIKANVYLKDWSNYSYQFNHLNQLKERVLNNFKKLSIDRLVLSNRIKEIWKYIGENGKKVLKEELNNIKNTKTQLEINLNTLNDKLKTLKTSIDEKTLATDNLTIDKSLTEVISYLDEKDKEYRELLSHKDSMEKDNARAIVLFGNMNTANVYEFISIMDYVLNVYEISDTTLATNLPNIQNVLQKDSLLYDSTSEKIKIIDSQIENYNLELRRLDDNKDLKELLENIDSKKCNMQKCDIYNYLKKYLNIDNEKDDIREKLNSLQIAKDSSQKLLDSLNDKIYQSKSILDSIIKINDFLYKKRENFINFSPQIIEILSIEDIFQLIGELNKIKALIPNYKEYIHYLEKMNNIESSINELKNTKHNITLKSDLEKEVNEYEQIKKEIELLSEKYKSTEEKERELNNLDETKQIIETEVEEFNKCVNLVLNQKQQILNLNKAKYLHTSLTNSLRDLENQKILKEKEYNELESEREQLKTDYINKQQLEKIRNKALEELNRYKALMEIWSPKVGYPAWEIEDFLYRLKEETNEDLNALWFSNLTVEDFEIGQNMFSIIVRSNETLIPDASELSESERATLALAISFAIIEMNLSSKKYNITRLDEQDGMLDGIRRKAFLSTIETMINRMNCQTCFIVTHNNEFENTNADVILLTNPNDEMYSHLLKNKNILFHL